MKQKQRISLSNFIFKEKKNRNNLIDKYTSYLKWSLSCTITKLNFTETTASEHVRSARDVAYMWPRAGGTPPSRGRVGVGGDEGCDVTWSSNLRSGSWDHRSICQIWKHFRYIFSLWFLRQCRRRLLYYLASLAKYCLVIRNIGYRFFFKFLSLDFTFEYHHVARLFIVKLTIKKKNNILKWFHQQRSKIYVWNSILGCTMLFVRSRYETCSVYKSWTSGKCRNLDGSITTNPSSAQLLLKKYLWNVQIILIIIM